MPPHTEDREGETAVHKVASALSNQPRGRALVIGVALVAGGALVDYATGPEFAPLIFYLVPVALVAWAGRPRDAVLLAFLCAGAWLLLEATRGRTYTSSWILAWNALTRLAVFVVVAGLVTSVRRGQWFQEQVANEVEGVRRTPCPYCGSTDTLRLVRSLVCRSCQRSASLDDVAAPAG